MLTHESPKTTSSHQSIQKVHHPFFKVDGEDSFFSVGTNAHSFLRTDTPDAIQKSDLGWTGMGGRSCNAQSGRERALAGNGDWKELGEGECTEFFEDSDGMTCGGGFYKIRNLERGTCRTPRRDDRTFAPRRWTPEWQASTAAESPSYITGRSEDHDVPPGYTYDAAP
jgi:hypothetical protein